MPQRAIQAEPIPTSEARRRIDDHLRDIIDPAPTAGLVPAECKALSAWKAQDDASRVLTEGADDLRFRKRLCFVAYLKLARGRFSEG